MYQSLILPDLKLMISEDDKRGMSEFCAVLHPAVAAEVFEELDPADAWRVLEHTTLERQVEIFEYLSLHYQVELVDSVDRTHLTRLLEEMAPDDRVDLLERLEPERVERLLPMIAQAERNDIRKLLSYEEDTAGSIMTTEYASLPADITIGEAIERLRRQAPDSETIYYVYILDDRRRLLGLVSLRELILARPETIVGDIMRRDIFSVHVDDDREDVAREIARYDFIAIPVVDRANQLVGIVTHDDVLDVIQEEATEDQYRLGAVQPLEDGYLDTAWTTITWNRGVWLMFLAVVGLINAKVLEGYKGFFNTYDWMFMFLPLVLGSGGNTGSQSATLIIRTLALGELEKSDNWGMVGREALIGCVLGLALGGVGFGAATLFFPMTVDQALVVGLTVWLVVVMGTVSGAVLPLIFKRLGMDPALMSNPLIAALVDVLGVVIYYTVTRLILGSLLLDGA